MSWTDKQLRKAKLRKQIDSAMNSPEYKKQQQEHDLKVFLIYCLISVDYLFRYEGYGEKRVKRFLNFTKDQMKYLAADDEYDFKLLNDALKDETGVDVMEYMGFELKEEEGNETSIKISRKQMEAG